MTTWRLQVVGDHDRLHDAFIDAETSTRVGDLQQALNDAGFAGQSLSLSGRSPGADEELGELDLEHGDRIGCGRPVHAVAPIGPGRFVVAVAGPESGLHVQLHDGDRMTFGRSGADIQLHDPFMSSRHFAVEAGAGGVILTDAGSTNGTMVEGATIDDAVVLSPGEYVHAGSSIFTIVDIDPHEIAVLGRRPPERVFAAPVPHCPGGTPRQGRGATADRR